MHSRARKVDRRRAGRRLAGELDAALLLIGFATPATAGQTPEFVGHSYELQYDNGFRVVDTFMSAETLHFKVLSQPTPGREGNVHYQWEQIGPHVYVIFWTEADGGTVVHVDDFRQHISRSYYTPPGQKLVRAKPEFPRTKAEEPVDA
jgi:hypothetical protein